MMDESQLISRLILPAAVALITTAIFAPLVGLFIQPYIEARKNRIVKERAGRIDVIILMKSIIGNINVVLDEAKTKNDKVLIPTMVSILSSRLESVEADAKELVRLLVHLGVYHSSLRRSEEKFIRDIAHIAGGAVKIRDNVTKNTQHSINASNGFRGINVQTMEGYIGNLASILDAVEGLAVRNRIRRKLSAFFRFKSKS